MTPQQIKAIIQLSRQGMASISMQIDPATAIAGWNAIAALQQEFSNRVQQAKEAESQPKAQLTDLAQ